MNNIDIVLNIIKKSEKNLSAYEILNKFQKNINNQKLISFK